jgi:hypothetical protein
MRRTNVSFFVFLVARASNHDIPERARATRAARSIREARS